MASPDHAEVVSRLDMSITITIRDLVISDLDAVEEFSSPSHVASVREHLERVERGEGRYFAAALPSGIVVGKACLDFRGERAPQVTQAAVHGLFQNMGIGTALLEACEDEARRRGYPAIHLGVDDRDPRPVSLYRRAGYQVVGSEPGSWHEMDADGAARLVTVNLVLMTKQLI